MFNKNLLNSTVGLDSIRSDLGSFIIESVRGFLRYTSLYDADISTVYKLMLNVCDTNDLSNYFKYGSVKPIDIYRCIVEAFLDYFGLEVDFKHLDEYDFYSTFFTCNIHEAVVKSVFLTHSYTSHSILTLYNIINDHKIEHPNIDNSINDTIIDSYESLKNYSSLCRMLDNDPSGYDIGINDGDINIISKICDHNDWTFIIPNDMGYAVRYKKNNGFKHWYTYGIDVYDLGYECDDDDNLLLGDEIVPWTYFFSDLIDYIKEDLGIYNKVVLLTSSHFRNNEAAA